MCRSFKKVFERKQNLDRHMQKHADDNNQHWPECLKVFTREDVLENHLHQEHEAPICPMMIKMAGMQRKGARYIMLILLMTCTLYRESAKNIEKFRTKATYYKINVNDMDLRELTNIHVNFETDVSIHC